MSRTIDSSRGFSLFLMVLFAEIASTTSKAIAKVKNAQKSLVDKSPIRVTSNKKRSSGSPTQTTTAPAPAKKKTSRLTYPHHPLLKNVCQRDLSEEKSANAVEILPIRKAVDSRGNYRISIIQRELTEWHL